MNLKLVLTGLVVAMITLTGCNRLATIQNVNSTPIVRYDGAELSMEEVERAIVLGGRTLGWEMRPVDEGHVIGTLNLRRHTAVVDVNYTTDSFSIRYRESQNLLYQPPDRIHRNYNSWVQNLKQAIHTEIDRIKVN